MSHPDPLIMSADIARVASERPELGAELVQALYQHLVLIESRQPAIDELRDYVDRLSSLDEHALRRRLGLRTSRKTGPRAPREPRRDRPKGTGSVPPTDTSVPSQMWVDGLPAPEGVALEAAIREGPERAQAELAEVDAARAYRRTAARGPGRPGWTDELFWTRYQEALGRATPPYTYRALALHFETLDGTRDADPEYLRKLVRRHGRPPE